MMRAVFDYAKDQGVDYTAIRPSQSNFKRISGGGNRRSAFAQPVKRTALRLSSGVSDGLCCTINPWPKDGADLVELLSPTPVYPTQNEARKIKWDERVF